MPLNTLTADEQVSFLRLILDSTVEGFYSVDTDGRTTLGNAACAKMLGYASADQLIGKKLHGLIHHSHPDGSHYEVGDCPIYNAASKGTSAFVPYELFFRQDGKSFPVEYRAVPIYKDGALQGAICTFIDISDRMEKDTVFATLRRQADEATERVELALDSGAVLGTWVWDVIADSFQGDSRFAQTFALDSTALKSGVPVRKVLEAIHPDDLPEVQRLIGDVLAKGGHYRAEYRVKQGKGWRWLAAEGEVELDASGKAVRFPGLLVDIDERKQIAATLDEKNNLLELAQNAGGIGLFSVSSESDIMHVSAEYCRIFGLPVTKTMPAADTEALTLAEDKHLHSSRDQRQAGTGALDVEYRIRRANDGAVRWIARRAEFVRDANGKVLQMVGVMRDVTERKTSALMLEESQAYLRLMLNSALDFAIITLDKLGNIVTWSPGAELIFGHKSGDVIGRHIELIFVPEDREHAAPQFELRKAAEQDTATDERWHQRENGERFYASGTMSVMRDAAGTVKGFVKIARDMTAHQRAQESLLEARNAADAANLAKTEFLANMSHEIRTPMNAIIGLSNILSGSKPLTTRQREFISTLQTSADSLLALINDLLDIAKIEARTVELEHIPFSVAQIMQEVASMMAVQVRNKGLRFTGEGKCVEGRMFLGDPTRLRQIVTNLCSNAIKFTDKGWVHVAITCHPAALPGHEEVRITVKDTGIGIPADKLDTIFKKFMQADTSINRKYGGTGLGLAITRTLVENMGGTIAVASEHGSGSVFEVKIPLEIASDQDIGEMSRSIAAVVETMIERRIKIDVLLVEDYEPNILVARTFLENFGYAVDVARNGLEAYEMVKAKPYVAVMMDVQMHGMNGFDSTKLIREYEAKERRTRVPIIGMTAHALAGDKDRCIACGMDDYIAKPFNPDNLREKIKALIGGARGT